MPDFQTLADLSSQAYDPSVSTGYTNITTGVVYTPVTYVTDISLSDNLYATGFGAQSFYSAQDNTLVIAYAGTNGNFDSVDTGLDFWVDLQLAVTGSSVQNSQALSFANQQIAAARAQYGNDISILFTGHSLGGYLAQFVIQEIGEGTAVAFNAPGIGGGILGTDAVNDNVSYVYSDPFAWGAASVIHNLADILSDNVYFIQGAEGHSLNSIISAYEGGRVSLSADQWGAILAEGLRTGELSFDDIIPFLGSNDIVRDTVLQSMRDSGTECFGPEVPIDMWPLDPEFAPDPNDPFKQFDQDAVRAKIWKKPIRLIRVGDYVVSHDKNGNMVPGYIPRTMTNDVKILLDFHGTAVTPGHVYYRPDSKKADKYETLIDVLRDDGMIEHRDGIKLRAATNVPVGDPRDGFVQAVTQIRKADGTVVKNDEGRIRLGTRFLVGEGKSRKSFAVADLIEHGGGVVGEDELIRVGDGEPMPFLWDFGETLPKPEDFVLACSGTTLEDIYKAAEWENQGPRLAAPMVLDRGPVQPLKGAALSAIPRNEMP